MLAEKGTKNPNDSEKMVDSYKNYLDQIVLTDKDYEKIMTVYKQWLLVKLGLAADLSKSEIEDKLKKEFEKDSSPYFREFLEEKFKWNVDELNHNEFENQYKIFEKELLQYFSHLLKLEVHMIKLSPEEINTLKQFLKDYYLSITDIEKILKATEFKAAYPNVKEKIDKLLSLDLIEQITPTGNAYIAGFKGGKKYYKLTTCGLFYALKEIRLEDIDCSVIKPDFQSRIFEIYKNDPLLKLFLRHDLIDTTVLSKFTTFDIKWIFTEYLKQICQEISKELVYFYDFQKNGVTVGKEVKWNRNLKDKKTEWNTFINRLLGEVIPIPIANNDNLKSKNLITDPYISDKFCSFSYDNTKYSIYIDPQKKIAKLCLNDQEFIKAYDQEKGEEYIIEHEEIVVENRPHCFVLKRVRRDLEDYIRSLTRRFLIPIRNSKTQLVYSILKLFYDEDYTSKLNSSISQELKHKYSREADELSMLASDSKIRCSIDNFYKEVNSRYLIFTNFNK